jgi:sporulation-control protein spo0M
VGSQFASSLSQNRICLSEFEVVFLIDHDTLELMLADRRRWLAVL